MRAAGTALLLTLAAAPAQAEPWRWPPWIAPPEVPADNPMSEAKVVLGRRLFYDADLSIDGTLACASCHVQKRGFADGNRTRPGVHDTPGRRNVPGLANVAWTRPLTWADPRLTDLEAQALVPIAGLHPVEMGMAGREAELALRLAPNACYRELFRAAFPERQGRIDLDGVARALASFQRSFVSYGAPVDRGAAPGAGAALFARDCASCHSGPNFSDGRFHAIGGPDGPAGGGDRGLAETTGRAEDAGRFRTPGLRNVAVTGPYLHDGRAATLAAAIEAHGLHHAPDAVPALAEFLAAMTDPDFLSRPDLSYAACPPPSPDAP